MSAFSMLSQETSRAQNYLPLRDEKLQKSLLRHQQEMERLIKNISARIHMQPGKNFVLTHRSQKAFILFW